MSHVHPGQHVDRVEIGRVPKIVLCALLAACAVASVVGVALLWPDSDAMDQITERAEYAAPGVSFPRAEVTAVLPPCPPQTAPGSPNAPPEPTDGEQPERCGEIEVTVSDGAGKGDQATVQVSPDVSRSGLRAGDRVQLVRTPATEEEQATYGYFATDRREPLGWLLLAFLVVVVAVARLRGVMAVIGLGFSAVVVVKFMLPALLTGESGLLVAVTSASAIMFVVLYSTHGLSMRTSAALAGTLVGIVLTAAIGWWAVRDARMTGVTDETGQILSMLTGDISFQGLLTAAVVIAGLGVLNDVTITQASAVWELRAAAPTMPRRRIYVSAMRIGRDHIASTIYTIVFAYAGTALTVLLLLYLYQQPVLDIVSAEELAEEILRTLTSAIGLVLAVPLTTAIAALVASPSGVPSPLAQAGAQPSTPP